MKAQELRIGNLFDYHGQSVHVMIITDSVGFERFIDSEDFPKPIPLTPEWLEKFGFKSDLEDWYYITTVKDQYLASNPHGVYLSNTDPEDESKHADEFSVKLDIRYVHQLQNLYFALTGSELQVKQ